MPEIFVVANLLFCLGKCECKTNFKITFASCWTALPNGIYDPCNNDGCCWAVYKICYLLNQDGDYEYTYQKLAQSDHSTDCQMSTRLCIFMCDTFPDYLY